MPTYVMPFHLTHQRLDHLKGALHSERLVAYADVAAKAPEGRR